MHRCRDSFPRDSRETMQSREPHSGLGRHDTHWDWALTRNSGICPLTPQHEQVSDTALGVPSQGIVEDTQQTLDLLFSEDASTPGENYKGSRRT